MSASVPLLFLSGNVIFYWKRGPVFDCRFCRGMFVSSRIFPRYERIVRLRVLMSFVHVPSFVHVYVFESIIFLRVKHSLKLFEAKQIVMQYIDLRGTRTRCVENTSDSRTPKFCAIYII